MSGQKLKENTATLRNASFTSTTTASDTIHSRRRNAQNCVLVWVDASIDQSKKDHKNMLAQLRSIVNDVNICTQSEQCIQCLNTIEKEKAFIIVSELLAQHLVPDIHAMPQLDIIYILCNNKTQNEQWTKEWNKIKGVYTSIISICEELQMAVKQCNQDSIPVSFVTMIDKASNQNLNQLEPSFMYTQMFKEILLEMEYDQQSIKDFALYCRNLYDNNINELKIINEFENNYRPELSIWWYTRECFTHQMLNRALRTLEGNTITNMGFFIHDLHHRIKELHQQQVDSYNRKSFIVYRGQGLLTVDFQKLCKTKGGLMSFNNFLSTSKHQEVSLGFARSAFTKTDMVGILFQMFIDPIISSTPFAAIKEISYFQAEEEILFSMHTVFRIGKIIQIDNKKPLYQVELKLTSDDDQELRILTERIREEASGTGWQRMGDLLITIGQCDKAEELYKSLLEQTSNDSEKAIYYNQLGYVKEDQGDYEKAISFYEEALAIYQKNFPENHSSLATSYNNIGGVYMHMKEYPKALSFYEKALEIRQKILHENHPSLATSYNNIASVYDNMGEYSKALSFYDKALEILQITLPANHPNLASSYNNIGEVYRNMAEYSKALSSHEKALEIKQRSLPTNHSDFAISYNNIGGVYLSMGEYSKAFSSYERALKILQSSLPATHPTVKRVQKNIEFLKENYDIRFDK